MNKEKQIEEMARLICLSYNTDACKKCDDSDFCSVKDEAQRLYTAGYRKADEVAREIFADLKQMWDEGRGFIKYPDLVRLERLYEQQYTEET